MAATTEDAGRLLAERRAKLAKLREEVSVHDRDITSAPPVTLVDEFHETFGAADQRHGGAAPTGDLAAALPTDHKIFYAKDGSSKGPPPASLSDLDHNALVREASQRNHHKSSLTQQDDLQLSPPADHRGTADLIGSAAEGGLVTSLAEDLGYQSSASSPSESKGRHGCAGGGTRNRVIDIDVESTKMAAAATVNLSQSMPEGILKAVKTDLAQSLGAIAEKAKSRGIYDPIRLFENGGGSATEVTVMREEEGEGGRGDKTERDYFQRMSRLEGRVRESVVGRSQSFQHFLHQSFSGVGGAKGEEARRRRSRVEQLDTADNAHMVSHGAINYKDTKS